MSYETFQGKALEVDVRGKTVLSIGGYDARHAASCLTRGAARVICCDSGQWELFNWSSPEHYPGVEYFTADVLDWGQPAEIVEFNNVIYHVKSPWLVMEHLHRLTTEMLVLTTSYVPGDEPTWRIYDSHTPRHVYWKPTLNGLYTLLVATGFANWNEVGRSGDHIVLRCFPTEMPDNQ